MPSGRERSLANLRVAEPGNTLAVRHGATSEYPGLNPPGSVVPVPTQCLNRDVSPAPSGEDAGDYFLGKPLAGLRALLALAVEIHERLISVSVTSASSDSFLKVTSFPS